MKDEMDTEGERLTRSILAGTSGSPCDSARDRLVGHADRTLEPIDAELLQMHVDGCTECAALVAALCRASADLPLLAEFQPDARFAGEVLARTTRRPSLAARTSAWAAVLLRRPRLAWEVAYVGTFVITLAFAAPGSPLAGIPERALELARVNPIQELEPPVTRLGTDVSRRLGAAWDSAESGVRSLRRWLGTLWGGAASDQVNDEHTRESER
jgi:hypothetical protein